MRIRIKPTEKDCERYRYESYSELLFDDPQIYNWARLVFAIDEEGMDIDCLDIFDDRIIARLKFAPPEDDDA